MSEIENIRANFENKLKDQQKAHEKELQEQLAELQNIWRREVKPYLLAGLKRGVEKPEFPPIRTVSLPSGKRLPNLQALVKVSQETQLREMDKAFLELFDLQHYFSKDGLNYPTVYCETLEEFFTPIVQAYNLSPQAEQKVVEQLSEDAHQQARERGGGIFGVNLPGVGCYLNGWLFGQINGVSAQGVLQDEKLILPVLTTIAHEKLGHGFLTEYSALGAVKKKLGLSSVEIAERFGIHEVENMLSSLRRQQSVMLLRASRFQEEGWATWIETFLGTMLLNHGQHPKYNVQMLADAVQNFPRNLPDRRDIVENALSALQILFGEQDYPPEMLHKAILFMRILGEALDAYFYSALGQPLWYALGEQLVLQVAVKQGALCAPYALLIAANMTFDPGQISLSDLQLLLDGDHRLNPDARLVAISRICLQEMNNVAALAQKAWDVYSFTAPPELKG